MPQALQQPYSANDGRTYSRVLARPAEGNLRETAGIGTGSHQPPRQKHPCEILQAKHQTAGKAPDP